MEHGRGEVECLTFSPLLPVFFDISIELTPPSLRATHPLYFAVQNTEEEVLIPFYRIIYRMRRIVFGPSPLPCPVALRGVAQP